MAVLKANRRIVYMENRQLYLFKGGKTSKAQQIMCMM